MRHLPKLLVVLVVAAACGGSEPATTSTTQPQPTTTTTVGTTEPAPTTTIPPTTTTTVPVTTTTEPAGTLIEITVTGEEVTGGGRVSVPFGEEVTVRVTADRADELHVHGYDLFLDLEAGKPGELTFVADIPGIFEIELESSHLLLVSLEVGA